MDPLALSYDPRDRADHDNQREHEGNAGGDQWPAAVACRALSRTRLRSASAPRLWEMRC
jgi:hypothetical protein